ncbi:tape measure protein [Gordonia phage Xenia2]
MPDYDLGTAHGEIVISHDDKANRETARALRELRSDIKNLEHQISDLNNVMRAHAAALAQVSKSTSANIESTGKLTAAQKEYNRSLRESSNLQKTFNNSLKVAGNIARDSIGTFLEFGKNYIGLQNVSLAAKDMVGNMVKLGLVMNTVGTRTRGLRNALQTTHEVMSNMTRLVAGTRNGLTHAAHAMKLTTDGALANAKAFSATRKAYHDYVRETGKVIQQTEYFGNTVGNFVANKVVGFSRSMGNLTIRVAGLKKALQELGPVTRTIYNVSMAIVTLNNIIGTVTHTASQMARAMKDLAGSAIAPVINGLRTLGVTAMGAASSLGRLVHGFISARMATAGYIGGLVRASAANVYFALTTDRIRSVLTGAGSALAGYSRNIGSAARSTALFQNLSARNRMVIRGVRQMGTAFTLFGGSMAAAGGPMKAMGQLFRTTFGPHVFGGMAASIVAGNRHLSALADRMNQAGISTARFGRMTRDMSQNIVKMSGGLLTAVSGFALMKRAMTGIRPMLQKIVFGMQGVVLAAVAIGAAGGAIMGLGNALRQLSGIVGLLPGAITAAALSLGPLIVGLMGVAKAFGAGTKEGEEFATEVAKLSPGMKKVAYAVRDTKAEWKGLRDLTTDTMFRGFDEEIRGLTRVLLPSLQMGLGQTSHALNGFIRQITGHLREPETIHQLNSAFTDTANLTANLSRAFGPLLDGLRAFGTEGLSILAGMSRSASNMTAVFEVWAKSLTTPDMSGVSRLDQIVQRSITGWGQLASIIKDAFGIMSDFFHAIGEGGTNALDRWSKSIEATRSGLQELYATGGIDNIASAFQTLAGHMMQAVKIILDGVKGLNEGFLAAGPEIQNIAEALSVGFVNGVRKAVTLIGGLIKLLANIPGIDAILGVAAGMITLFKATGLVIAIFTRFVAALVGPIMAFKGLVVSIGAYVAAVRAGASGSVFMQRALQKLKISALGAQIALSALGAAFGIAVLVMASWGYASEKNRQKNEEMEASLKKTTQGFKDFRDAVYEANGAIDTTAIDALAVSLEGMYERIEQKAEDGGTLWQAVGDEFQKMGSGLTFGMWEPETDTHQKFDDIADAVKRGKERLDSYGLSMQDLARIAAGSSTEFNSFRQNFVNMGTDGEEVVAMLDNARQKVLDTTAAAKAIGPAGLDVANGLAKMGEEGASTTDKLEGLKQVLQGLGLIQTSAEQQMFEYQEELRKLGDTSQYVIDQSASMGKAMLLAGNKLDPANKNAYELDRVLNSLSDKFLANAAAGNDSQKMYNDLLPQIRKVGEAYGFQGDEILGVIKNYGLVPAEVHTIMALAGADIVEQDIGGLALQIATLTDKPKVIKIQSAEAVEELRKLGLLVEGFNAETQTANISIAPGQNAQQVAARLNEWLKQHVEIDPKLNPNFNQNLKKQVEDGGPVEVLINPKYTNNPKFGRGLGVLKDPNAEPAPTTTPKPAEKPGRIGVGGSFDVDSVKQAESSVNNLKKSLDGIKDVVATVKVFGTNEAAVGAERLRAALDAVREKTVTVKVFGTNEAAGPAERLRAALEGLKSVEINVTVTNLMETVSLMNNCIDAFNNMGTASGESMKKVVEAFAGMKTAAEQFKTVLSQIDLAMVALANSGFTRGATLGQGFANGILSKLEVVRQAATDLATAASDPLPNSPAKTGPFSRRGWTPYRGRALAVGFADGIAAGKDGVASVALDLATAVSAAIDSISPVWNGVDTEFDANKNIPGAAKYYRDPSISDADLRKARKERQDELDQQAKDDAYRASKKAGEDIPDQERKVKDAEQSVRDAEKDVREAKDAEDIKRANDRLAEAQVDLKNDRDELKRMRDSAAANPGAAASGAAGAGTSGKLRANPNRTDYIAAMTDIASRFNLQMTSGMRDEPGSYHSTGTAADFSNGSGNTPEMLAFANFIADNFKPWTKELIYDDPRFNRQIGDGEYVDKAYYANAGDHTNHVHWAVSEAPEWTGAIGKAVTDSINKGAEDGAAKASPKVGKYIAENVDTVPLVQNPDGTWSSPSKEWDHLIERESGGRADRVQEIVDANSGGNEASGLFQIAKGTWAGAGGKEFAETAGQATAEQQAIIAARIFNKSGGGPWGAGLAGRESEEGLRAGLVKSGAAPSSGGSYGSATEDTAVQQLEALRTQNKSLDSTLDVLENPNSSDREIIQNLQALDGTIKNTEDPDIREQLEQIRDNTMTDRGIKKYDEEEGKSEDPIGDTIGIAQNVLGIYNALESGLQNAGQLFELAVRGFENTKDINTFVDGVQSLVSTVTGIVDTVASVAGTVASLAALAGSAIPGVGQALAAVSAVTGGIGQVQSVIDLIQDGFQIAGRWIGTALSWLVGGGDGPLQGDVKALLDTNSQTLKFWSSDNALDKRDVNLDPFSLFPDRATGMTSNQYNIYANPNAPASEIVNELGYALRVQNSGAYQE